MKSPEEEWGRFFMDDSKESQEAFQILRAARFPYITIKRRGSLGPELKLGRQTYESLEEIRALVEEKGR